MKTVSAYKARTNFGELINRAYYNHEEIIIERKGKAMVKISRIDESKEKARNLFKEAAGAWNNLDSTKLIKNIYKSRKDISSKKKFLASW